jgi:peroxiredoxin
MKEKLIPILCLLGINLGTQILHADWAEVTALDLPLTKLSANPAKAKSSMAAHFTAQINVNKIFLRDFPHDPRSYESKVRLEVAKARLASLEKNSRDVDDSLERLMLLEKQAPDSAQRAETMFRRISLQWQNLGDDADVRRDRAVTSARVFSREFPNDRRAPRLLAEASTLCDNNPELKRRLVNEALALENTSPDPSLKLRLEDDLRRLDQLGKPVPLNFRDADGATIDLSNYRGDVVAVVFWAAESAPCLVWIRDFANYASITPGLKVIGVSLDQDQNDLKAATKALHIDWPTAFDGKGWQSPLARGFGINALPTLWLIDKHGCLQSLNARENYQLKIKELLLKR